MFRVRSRCFLVKVQPGQLGRMHELLAESEGHLALPERAFLYFYFLLYSVETCSILDKLVAHRSGGAFRQRDLQSRHE